MPSPDQKSVLKGLAEAKDYAQRVGVEKEAAVFEEFHSRFQTEKPTLKALRSAVEPVRNQFSITIRDTLYDDFREPRPGMVSNSMSASQWPFWT